MRIEKAAGALIGVLVAAFAGMLLVPGSSTGMSNRDGAPGGEAATAVDTSYVIGAAGDFACDPVHPKYNKGFGTDTGCAQRRVSNRAFSDYSLDAFLGLGDYQYDCSDPADWQVSYNPTWGRLDSLFRPTVGNHEYKTTTDLFGTPCPASNSTAKPYFDHFGASARPASTGHYSFDLGSWHLIGLNGNCTKAYVGGCSATSAQTTWLKNDLASTTQPCIAAFWHQPLYTGIAPGKDLLYRPWWEALYAARADVVLNGHTHNYQRYAPMDPYGTVNLTRGMTQYVAGTGGVGFASVSPDAAPQPKVWFKKFGYLRVHLLSNGWSAEFVDPNGVEWDKSSGTCHPAG
jgi:hypothetical protein